MPNRLRACDAAVEAIRAVGSNFVMQGDEHVLHDIAERLGWEHSAWETSRRVLRALSKTPGPLRKGYTELGNGRRVLIFRMPEETP